MSFWGTAWTMIVSKFADEAINQGIDAVLGGDESGGGGARVSPPNMEAARILSSSAAGDPDLTFGTLDYAENSYESNLQDWEKRLTEYAQSRPVVSKID
jgi:hypothetical protein|tara:strand:+ start:529 stop:825 length:297 start_codon:yes stop_codon:yes gene_type:complete